jgi:hypothetical protein
MILEIVCPGSARVMANTPCQINLPRILLLSEHATLCWSIRLRKKLD